MRATRCEAVDTTPVWIMRQAGRYLPEYRAVRNTVTFLELCKTPELAAKVTLDAQRILGVDAAILFADLLPILEPMGFGLEYLKGEGPVIHQTIREAEDVDRVVELEELGSLQFVFDAVKLIRRDLPANIPLLGFAGAPFTLASYAIEGGGSKNYIRTKTLMYSDDGVWNALMSKFVRSLSRYLVAQLEAGCQAVQIFDSWAGCLSPSDYARYVQPHTKALIDSLPEGATVVNFLTGNPALVPLQAAAGGRVVGLDWRVDLRSTREALGFDRAVQGNLDPISIFAPLPVLRERVADVLDAAGGRPGHVFNLGHGVTPEMDPDHVKALVEMVHELGSR